MEIGYASRAKFIYKNTPERGCFYLGAGERNAVKPILEEMRFFVSKLLVEGMILK